MFRLSIGNGRHPERETKTIKGNYLPFFHANQKSRNLNIFQRLRGIKPFNVTRNFFRSLFIEDFFASILKALSCLSSAVFGTHD